MSLTKHNWYGLKNSLLKPHSRLLITPAPLPHCRYIKQSEDMYQDYQREVQQLLVNLADEALAAQYSQLGKVRLF